MNELLIGTTNVGKFAEFEQILGGGALSLVSLSGFEVPEVIEDGASFEANARKKANQFALATGLPCLADDSGLVVDALQGAPGIHSARFAGVGATDTENNEKLLGALGDVVPEKRSARYECVLAFANAKGEIVHCASGSCEGVILESPKGKGGFGYDPLFVSEGYAQTMAELDPEQKHAISHRGRAIRALRPKLLKWFATP